MTARSYLGRARHGSKSPHPVPVDTDHTSLFAGHGIPSADGSIITPGDNQPVIRRKSHAVDGLRLPSKVPDRSLIHGCSSDSH